MCTHVFQGEEVLFGDGVDDVALADAVTTTDFRCIGHRRDAVIVAVAGIAEVRLAKQQFVADIRDVSVVAHQFEVPGTVDGVAVHDRALNTVVLEHDFFVDAKAGILQDQFLGAVVAVEIAGREQVDAGHFQLGRGHRTFVAGDAQLREVVGADLGLLEQRCDQAVGLATVLHAFADRIDARIEGLHGVADDNAALAVQTDFFRQLDVRFDADRHHYQVGGDFTAVLETHRFDLAVTGNGLGLCFHEKTHAAFLE